MPTLALLLLLLFQQSKEATSVERTIVPFSYGWRFHYGDDHSSPPGDGPGGCNDAFDVNLANVGVCQNMERNPNRFSPKDCKIACCYDPTCLAWQAYPIALGRQCFHYYNRADSKSLECPPLRPGNLSGLQGGRRDRTPNPAFRTDYYFASDSTKDFDRNWSLIDIPHDFIASRANFTNDITNFKQGYLPRVRFGVFSLLYLLKHDSHTQSLLECELVQKTFHSTRGMGSRRRRDLRTIRRCFSSLHSVFERRVLVATR